MMRKGFTLIEALIGISLLGLITVTVLPIVNSAYARYEEQKIRAEMIYLGESIIEKIKGYDFNIVDSPLYDRQFEEMMSFIRYGDFRVWDLNQEVNGNNYKITIHKETRSEKLWRIIITVYEKGDGDNKRQVKYEALVLAK